MKNIKKVVSAIEKIRMTDVENGESLWAHETNGTIIVSDRTPIGNYTHIMTFPRYAEWKQKYEYLTEEFEQGQMDEEEYLYQTKVLHFDGFDYTDDIDIQFYQLICMAIENLK